MLLATADWPSPIDAPGEYKRHCQCSILEGLPRSWGGGGSSSSLVVVWNIFLPASTLLTEECVARPGCPLSWKIPAYGRYSGRRKRLQGIEKNIITNQTLVKLLFLVKYILIHYAQYNENKLAYLTAKPTYLGLYAESCIPAS